MLIVTYDIQNDRLRTRFARFLKKYGYRLQYSVFEIKNSSRILALIEYEIKNNFEKKFTQGDSVLVFNLSKQCHIMRFGYAKNDEEDLIFVE